MRKYRIGISGAGFGVNAHLPALAVHPRFDVVAIASPHSAPRIAAERHIPHAFGSSAAMVEGCELDAVIVASPPFAHHEDVLTALAASKHVLCEKPFALNVDQAKNMNDAARQAGTACGVVHEFRFVPQAQALKELAEHHHLDPLRDMEITLLRPFLRRHDKRSRSWWFERERGGGLAGAMLSHVIDQASWLSGRPPRHSMGFARTANPTRSDDSGEFVSTVDDGAFALLDYGEGLAARLAVDGTTAVEGYTCALHGENRTAVASGPNITELALFSIENGETSELTCTAEPYAKYRSINGNVPLLLELYDEFVKKIEGKRNALPTFAEALVTQEVLASVGFGASSA